MTNTNNRLGAILMVTTTFVFAVQDGLSQHLAREYNVLFIVMIRYWFFASFVIVLASRNSGGIRQTAKTGQLFLQILRGLLLAGEICVAVYGFTLLGLVESHALFATYPLLIAALSGPVLGENVGWRRWLAIMIGFCGILIILRPGYSVFSPFAIIPLTSALMFALYGLLTRFVSRKDSSPTSFFWTGVSGAVAMTVIGIWYWVPMTPSDTVLMLVLCLTGVLGHFTLIKCYEAAEASAVQPFAYLQLVFASLIGLTVFGEALSGTTAIGTGLIVAAGLVTLWRARRDE